MRDDELPVEEPFEGEHDDGPGGGEDLLERFRGTGVGVEDENIVGDVGPTDVPPGADPDGGLFEEPAGGTS